MKQYSMNSYLKYILKSSRNISALFFLLFFACSGSLIEFQQDKDKPVYGYNDGPYLLYTGSQAKTISVAKTIAGAQIFNEYFNLSEIPSVDFKVLPDSKNPDGSELEPFEFRLFNFKNEEQWDFPQPEKIFALSDIECHFYEFITILKAGEVIDDNYNWTYGNGHLVVHGDAFNRGLDLMAILWLTYKLDYQSALAGGKVHFMIGNHEEMALRGDVRYTESRYLEFAKKTDIEYKELFGQDSELGRWLRTKNSIIRIGKNVFVHGGISMEFIERGITIPEANQLIRENLGKNRAEFADKADFLFRTWGPLWYRGMVLTSADRKPLSIEETSEILQYFDAERVIVGHCKGPDIATTREGMVVVIDVNHPNNRFHGISRALLIQSDDGGERLFKVNDKGELKAITDLNEL